MAKDNYVIKTAECIRGTHTVAISQIDSHVETQCKTLDGVLRAKGDLF